MRRILTLLWLLCASILSACQPDQPAVDATPKQIVISTIKPVQALAQALADIPASPWEVRKLLPDGASPHHYALKPSDMRTLQDAKLILRIDPGLETFLDKPLAGLPDRVRVITLSQVQGIEHLPLRTPHTHAETDTNKDHDAHDPDSDEASMEGQNDLHIWLNPRNAVAMTRTIAQAFAQADPANQTAYLERAEQLIQQIRQADARISQQLQGVRNQPYLSFHDAWQHFDHHYGLHFAGAVTLDVSHQPGTRHVQAIRQMIVQKQAVCLFQEPQFPPALVNNLIENTSIRLGELDPLGMNLPLDENTYVTLLEQAAAAFRDCLSERVEP